jgi:hypothetical protein
MISTVRGGIQIEVAAAAAHPAHLVEGHPEEQVVLEHGGADDGVERVVGKR